MTQNRAGLEDYAPAPAGDKVKCIGGILVRWQGINGFGS